MSVVQSWDESLIFKTKLGGENDFHPIKNT